MHVPRTALLLALALFAAGCTGSSGSGVKSVNGVARENVVLQGNGVNVTPDAANGTILLSVGAVNASSVQACDGACKDVGIPPGFVVAEGSLVSLNNLSLNARGPERNSAVFFYDDGSITGEFLQWIDERKHFELSRGLDVLGNLTARHHIGTVTAVILNGQTQIQIATAALEGNEAAIFLRGSGQLQNGTATVAFPAPFKVLVGGNVTAQVTATARGAGLFVSEKAIDHIKVETLDGSASSQTFDFFVQATRAASGDFASVLSG